MDVYYLGIHNDHATYASGTGDEHRHSLGAREFGAWKQWDWNAEQVIQFGSFGSDSILAWTAAINAGYTWDAPFQPRLGIKTGIASGDDDRTTVVRELSTRSTSNPATSTMPV